MRYLILIIVLITSSVAKAEDKRTFILLQEFYQRCRIHYTNQSDTLHNRDEICRAELDALIRVCSLRGGQYGGSVIEKLCVKEVATELYKEEK